VTVTTAAAITAAVILGGLAVFQLALALGAPYGRYAWGGRYAVLPTPLRIASLITMAVYALCAVILLDRAGVIDVLGNAELVRIATWVMVGLFAVGTLMNLASRSADERRVMTPVALVLCLLSLVVALGW
jgi:hypothetical protein